MTYIPVEMRRQVRADAGGRCGYCRTAEHLTGTPLEIDHLIPESTGGLTIQDNLWLACHRCNEFKGDRTVATDPDIVIQKSFFRPPLRVPGKETVCRRM
ncbi:MAG: HNH endonuclease [Chloroflexi bacterium]|nr:HNH endonuclease [Chloroflexota bacterium]